MCSLSSVRHHRELFSYVLLGIEKLFDDEDLMLKKEENVVPNSPNVEVSYVYEQV